MTWSLMLDGFTATLLRTLQHKLRSPIALAVECLLPLVFVGVVIALWRTFGMEYAPPESFNNGANRDTVYSWTVCHNTSAGSYDVPYKPCSTFDSEYSCAGDESDLPVKGICYASRYGAAFLVRVFIKSVLGTLAVVPSFDSLVTNQWLAYKSNAFGSSLLSYLVEFFGVSSSARYTAMSCFGDLYFAPAASIPSGLIEYFNSSTSLFKYVYGGTFETVEEALSYVENTPGQHWGVVEINSFTEDDLDVTIHLKSSALPSMKMSVDRLYAGGYDFDHAEVYAVSGFLTIQHMILDYYVQSVTSSAVPFTPMIMSMPVVEADIPTLLINAGIIVPFILVMAFLYSVSRLTKATVLEKELRIREAMLIMGLTTPPMYISWFLIYAVQYLVVSMIMSVMAKYTFLPKSDLSIIFAVFYLFALSTIPFSGLVAAVLNKARIASLVAPVVYFLCALPLFAATEASEKIQLGLSILSPSAFSVAMRVVIDHEVSGGMSASNFRDPSFTPPVSLSLMMLGIDFVVYTIIMMYLDAVMPRTWGTPKHPLFFILDPINCIFRSRRKSWETVPPRPEEPINVSDTFGMEMDTKPLKDYAISMCGIRKEFTRDRTRFVAVNNLNWGLQPHSISVLLGHNGAGKSTVMSIMTGMITPDSGDGFVLQKSVVHQLAEVRKELGYCPQHNILWPDLTCREHLRFFGRIKGLGGADLEESVQHLLGAVGLQEKGDDSAGRLSGGQKRKLSVALAFVGRAPVVFLDEPTAGMDVSARRLTWHLLQSMNSTCTILLTTHYMDEADLLGHHIGIMSAGRLRCCGSSLFLKSRLGKGYTLTLSVKDNTETTSHRSIAKRIRSWAPCAVQTESNLLEMAFLIPRSHEHQIPDLLRNIDTCDAACGIRGYALTMATMEQVFLQVSQDMPMNEIVDLNQDVRRISLPNFSTNQDVRRISIPNFSTNQDVRRISIPNFSTNQDVRRISIPNFSTNQDVRRISIPNFSTNQDVRRISIPNFSTGSSQSLVEMETWRDDGNGDSVVWENLRGADDEQIQLIPSAPASRRTSRSTVGTMGGSTVVAPNSLPLFNLDALEGSPLLAGQMGTMLKKRLRCATRDKKLIFFQIVCPVVCILLAMLLTLIKTSKAASTTLSVDTYGTKVSIPVANCNFLSNTDFLGANAEIQKVLLPSLNDFSNFLRNGWWNHTRPRYGAVHCLDNDVTYGYGVFNPAVVLYNTTSYHEVAIGVGNLYRGYLAAVTQKQANMNLRAATLVQTKHQQGDTNAIKTLLIGAIIMIPLTFLPSNVVAWIVKERECGARHLQRLSGVRFSVYWVSNWIFDIITYCTTEALMIITFVIFQRTEYIAKDTIGATLVLLFVFGTAGTGMAYALSFFFKEHSSAQTVVMALSFVTGFLLVMIVFVLSMQTKTQDVSEKMRWGFRLIPSYSVGEGIINLAMRSQKQRYVGYISAWDMDVVGWPCVYMAAEVPLFVLITVVMDHSKLRAFVSFWGSPMQWIRCCAERRRCHREREDEPDAPTIASEREDSDVEEEREHVKDAISGTGSVESASEQVVRVVNLHHKYPNGKVAVKDLSFGIYHGEVFALLGTNGAGKTTTTSVLCQEFPPTSGAAYICGTDVTQSDGDALPCTGYCPQFDALLDLLTAEEHLYMYCGVRGVANEQRVDIVQYLLMLFDLEEYRSTLSHDLSGGNKRKLSVAISLIGGPRVVFLDEPSAGMDPVARRGLWTAISAISGNCAVLLTTHHLEEVEALAHRVAIMVDGTLRCIGDKTHLKNKFGSGLEMSVQVSDMSKVEDVESFVNECFPGAVTNEKQNLRQVFSLPSDTSLADALETLQRNKAAMGITDCCVSQTSLEQVFLRLAAEADAAVLH